MSTGLGRAERRSALLAAIRHEGGEWTTARVQRLYRAGSWAAPLRATARHDLVALTQAGHLTCHADPQRRHYTPRSAA